MTSDNQEMVAACIPSGEGGGRGKERKSKILSYYITRLESVADTVLQNKQNLLKLHYH